MNLLQRMGMEKGKLNGKVAVVTGGASGIGKEAAKSLAWLGAKVVIADISDNGLKVAEEINNSFGKALYIKTDVADENSINNLLGETGRYFGEVDILINCAVKTSVAPFVLLSKEDWDTGYSIILRGAVTLMQKVIPGMLQRRAGAVITVISGEGMALSSSYCAYKMGLKSVVSSLGKEISPEQGVSVLAVVPGAVDTPLIFEVFEGISKFTGLTMEQIKKMVGNNPGYEGLIPAEHSGAALAYFILNAPEYHGQFVDGYLPLSQAGIINVEEEEQTGAENENYEKFKLINPKLALKELIRISQTLESKIQERTKQLKLANTKIEEKNKMMQAELELASKVQRGLLPKKVVETPEVKFAWDFRPSVFISGDMLNIYKIDPKHIGFYLLDAMGHGVPAALKSISCSYLLNTIEVVRVKEASDLVLSPAYLLGDLNKKMTLDSTECSFITIFYGILNLETREMKFARAGHSLPIIVSADGEIREQSGGGPAIGMAADLVYKDYSVILAKGDKIFLYTDGITEAQDKGDNLYTKQRLTDFLLNNYQLNIKELTEKCVEKVIDFMDGQDATDDMSILGFEIL